MLLTESQPLKILRGAGRLLRSRDLPRLGAARAMPRILNEPARAS